MAKRKNTIRGMLAFLLASVLVLGCVPAAWAAEDDLAVDPTTRKEGYSAVLYDSTNGLPTSEANAIAETDEGFLWFGGYSGLIRYDGEDFVRIDSTTGIASVMCLLVDDEQRLWIGTNDNGIVVMDKGAYLHYGTLEGLSSASVRSMAKDPAGNIYAGTTAGIDYIDPAGELHHVDDVHIGASYIRNLECGVDGRIYGLTQSGDVFSLADGVVLDYVGQAENPIRSINGIAPDPNNPGYLYIGTEDSTVYHGSITRKFARVDTWDCAPLSYLESFTFIGDMVWICAGNGIGMLENGRFYYVDNVPMNNSVGHAMRDYAGNLWFTSTRQGVMKIVPNQFSDVFAKYGLEPTVVNSTCRFGSKLFIATDSGLLVVGDREEIESVPLESAVTASGEDLGFTDLFQMLAGVRIRSISRDSEGRLWIATWRKYGLLRYDGTAVTAFNVPDGLFSDRVRAVYECSDGSFLVANTGGVNIIRGDTVEAGYSTDNGISNIEILTVCQADNGDYLLGTDGGGIFVLHGGQAHHLGIEEGLRSEVVMRIKRDPLRELYWIVTSNSIAYMDADYNVTTIEKFPYSNNFDLYENSEGEMWVLSSNGIYVLPAQELIENGDVNPVYYGRANGLPTIATGNSYSELTDDGDLYIAGSTGVAKVNIEVPFESVNDIKMAVPFVMADGVTVYPDEDGVITVPSRVRKVTVNSFVYTYSLMDPQVTYHLEGFDQGSTTVRRSDLGPVDYTNLKGGTYHFVMELKDALGHGSKELRTTIVKTKAVYEQTWFIIVCAVLGVLAMLLLVRLYTRRKTEALMRKHQEQKTLIREITTAFAKTIDMKDKYTNGHSARVARYTRMLSRELGCDEETVDNYYNIALLHDIGKIGIPPEVLNKPGKLTDEEFALIKSHSAQGYNVLKDISIMPELAIGAGSHHERPDGKGYPNHLTGEQIPRVAQIIAVADTFDAMYSNRPYRGRMNFDKAVSIIKEVSGTQLAPDVVDAFLRLVDKGEFRAPDDDGGGTTENIDNIHKKAEEAEKADASVSPEEDSGEHCDGDLQ